tara:strand:+ start:338 stop:778 length:441 start_codon:yes stop_codon:yes gene_type:complete
MPIKSFRGQLAHGAVDLISLHTNDGSTGYKIKKLELLQTDANENVEATFKVFSVPQTTATGTADFSDQTLLAAGMYWSSTAQADVHESIITFDNITFNQDIYLTMYDYGFAAALNYHIELELVKLDLNENTVATLKDLRNEKVSLP